MSGPTPTAEPPGRALPRLHFRFGWSALVLFVTLGAVLEGLHGFKAGFYLDVSNETRRFLWTLAHVHGALLSLVNVAFAATVHAWPVAGGSGRLTSRCLIGANVLMPAGFLLGGLDIYGGDPGPGAFLLVPPGALLLLVGVGRIALALRSAD